MPTTSTKHEALEKIRERIKDIRMAMLATTSKGRIVTRPMSTQEMAPDGTLWFLAAVDSNKVKEISQNASVGVAYADSGSETYVSIAGIARITNDRELIKKFWNPFYKAWFSGPDDPTIRVLEIEPVSAEYWITTGGKIMSLFSMFASAVTGKDVEMGENNAVEL